MNRWLQIVRRDFSSTFLLILVWWLFVGASTALGLRAESWFGERGTEYLTDLAEAPRIWISLILGIGLVWKDRPFGDRAFWLTRPMLWWELVSSKLAVLALAVVLPAVVLHLVVLRAQGLPPEWTLAASAEATLNAFLWLLVGAIAGSLSRSLRELGSTLVAGFLAVALAWEGREVLLEKMAWDYQASTFALERLPWGGLILPSLMFISLLIVVFCQYRWRRVPRTVLLGASLGVFWIALPVLASWLPFVLPAGVGSQPLESVRWSWEKRGGGLGHSPNARFGEVALYGLLRLEDKDGENFLYPGKLVSTLSFKGGHVLEYRGSAKGFSKDPLVHALKGEASREVVLQSDRLTAVAVLPREVFDRIRDEEGQLTVRAEWERWEPRYLGELALKPGVEATLGSHRFTIQELSRWETGSLSPEEATRRGWGGNDSSEGPVVFIGYERRSFPLRVRDGVRVEAVVPWDLRLWEPPAEALTEDGRSPGAGFGGGAGYRDLLSPLGAPKTRIATAEYLQRYIGWDGWRPDRDAGGLPVLHVLERFPKDRILCEITVSGVRPRELTAKVWHRGGSGYGPGKVVESSCRRLLY